MNGEKGYFEQERTREDELYRILNCPYYDKVYGCLDCYIEKCPYYEAETEEIQ